MAGVLYYKDPATQQWVPLSTTGPAGPAGAPGATGPVGPAGPAGPGGVPVGTIVAFAGVAAPVDWALCDGSAHGSPELTVVTGSPNTPDLRGRFLLATSAGHPAGQTGGAEAVTLTAAQSGAPAHGHTASSGTESADHAHLADPPNANTSYMHQNASHGHTGWTGGGGAHDHGSAYSNNWQGSDMAQNPSGTDYMPIGQSPPGHRTTSKDAHDHPIGIGATDTNHIHNVDVPAFWTGGINANHQHGITVDGAAAANAAQSHENMPPFYAVTYIIRTRA